MYSVIMAPNRYVIMKEGRQEPVASCPTHADAVNMCTAMNAYRDWYTSKNPQDEPGLFLSSHELAALDDFLSSALAFSDPDELDNHEKKHLWPDCFHDPDQIAAMTAVWTKYKAAVHKGGPHDATT